MQQYGNHRHLGHLGSRSALLALACIGTFKVDENPVTGEGSHKGNGALKVLNDTIGKMSEINLADPVTRHDTDIGNLGLPRATKLTDVDSMGRATLQAGRRLIRQPAPLSRHAGRSRDVMLN